MWFYSKYSLVWSEGETQILKIFSLRDMSPSNGTVNEPGIDSSLFEKSIQDSSFPRQLMKNIIKEAEVVITNFSVLVEIHVGECIRLVYSVHKIIIINDKLWLFPSFGCLPYFIRAAVREKMDLI
jgi:hypothetical protein